MLKKFDRIKLGHFPTPIESLNNISKYLDGPNIFIKRDDCSGLATGGNKTRKLEFLMPDAIKKKTKLVVTIGAVQSNHARQTAAACTLLGLKCLIILEQRLEDPPDSYMKSGNVFLDKLFGADVILCPKNENILNYSKKIIEDLKKKKTAVYFIPGGGSNELGALGYVECLNEIIKENKKYNFTHIVHATGSSGTQAGLLAGKKYFKCSIPVIGISVRFDKRTQEDKVYKEAIKTCELLQCDPLDKSEVLAFDEYVGKGYGIPTPGMIEATELLAKKEAILLDPVYSGKGFAGLIGLIRKKYFKKNDNVLFIHTGGAVSLHAYEWAFNKKS
jgi:L-cysteate sulfo-lyase